MICDIDGCLSPESSTAFDNGALLRIAEHNRAAAHHRDRPMVTLCSGRPQPFVEAMTRLIWNTTLPSVAENGVWLYQPGENVYVMDPAITPADKAAVRDARAWLEETYAPKGVQQQPGKSASVSLFHADTAYLKSLEPEIKGEFDRRGWPMRVSSTWLYINCDLKHVSKSTGLDRLIASAGLGRDRLAGIGDTMGDLTIRRHAAWFACPANASAEIKEHADFVSGKTEAEGVLEILERVMKER